MKMKLLTSTAVILSKMKTGNKNYNGFSNQTSLANEVIVELIKIGYLILLYQLLLCMLE